MMVRKAMLHVALAGVALVLSGIAAQAHPPGHSHKAAGHKAVGAAVLPATEDAPGNHGMFMVGTNTLFLTHMPMFTDEKHMYQVVLRARLSEPAMTVYQKLRAANPDKPYNLINVDNDKFTLPDLKSGKVTSFMATLCDGYSNDNGGTPGPVLLDNVPVTIDAVVLFRHFNFGINRPQRLIYTLFGANGEAHMTHYIARDPDFQHVLTLAAPPTGFSDTQLQAGIDLDFTDVASLPITCTPPITAALYQTLFAGRPDAPVSLDLTKGVHSIWYSTGNLLNAKDPCSK
jgi:hypothetical protein